MACKLCEKLKIKTKSINNNIMADQNDMVTITNGSQTRKVARIFFEAHCTKTWRIVDDLEPTEKGSLLKEEPKPEEPKPEEPKPEEPKPEEPKPEEITGPDLEPKTKKKK